MELTKFILATFCILAYKDGDVVDAQEYCYKDVSQSCGQPPSDLDKANCNALYGGYGRHASVVTELQAYANLHIERSYEYLLMSVYYNNYLTDRKGFVKLFRKLADDSWSRAKDLIKHITMRGGSHDFSSRSTQSPNPPKNFTVEVFELESIAKVLDTQKELAERAFYIHREETRNNEQLHDAEITQYLEEEFIEYHAKTIRELAGHFMDLKKFATTSTPSELALSLYLFDKYLLKIA